LTPRKLAASFAVAALSASALALGGGFASAAPTGAAAAGAAAIKAPATPAVAPPAPWKTAREVPGLSTLSKGDAGVSGVTCATAGDCVAVGSYTDGAHHGQAFLAAEKSGTWGKAIEVPGTAALNKGGAADALAVSCSKTTVNECTMAGTYTDSSHRIQLFVADEKGGHWGAAHALPGAAGLNTGGTAFISGLGCATTAHNCAVAGLYSTGSGDNTTEHALVASEKNGTWGNAIQVPGLGALKATHGSQVNSVACGPTPGFCAVTGFYSDSGFTGHAFVADEKKGTWGNAHTIPGVGADSAGTAIDCGANGGCAATGDLHGGQVYVAVEVAGTWHAGITIPGTASLNNGKEANAVALSCAPGNGNCATVGSLVHVASNKVTTATYVAEEIGGKWQAARLISGTIATPGGLQALPSAIDCPTAKNCAAVGVSTDTQGRSQGFTVNEAGGTWFGATLVPGLATLNAGKSAVIMSVFCAAPGKCAAGGSYSDAKFRGHAFITNE
jgi:hypothetical protein